MLPYMTGYTRVEVSGALRRLENLGQRDPARGRRSGGRAQVMRPRAQFTQAYAHPTAHRTSNMLDRRMDHMDRRFYNAHYFHGHLMTAEYAVRAKALLVNFQPDCPRAAVVEQYRSPAHKFNGFVYPDNWLDNLLISAPMGGCPQ
jgi:hypothetical protein